MTWLQPYKILLKYMVVCKPVVFMAQEVRACNNFQYISLELLFYVIPYISVPPLLKNSYRSDTDAQQ